ncbi:hypothetical protein [Nitrosopumilus sp.]|uniref:hypothetical protein n=1 Tax=Nitrosopumilus sp. TaxID=2024843 RepID=UPI002608EC36|nr:hypothetical protein [Nitrosopumilus sp.]
MTPKTLLGISVAAIFAIGIIASPIGVDAAGSFLDVKKAKVVIDDDDEFEKAKIKTNAKVLEVGAYGYGIISGAGLEAIAVTTTHGGVLDSEAQTDASDASFHNHYVALQDSQDPNPEIGTGLCPGLEVRDITWEEPGDVKIKGKKATMKDVPFSFSGTHSLSGDDISFNADGNVGAVVSFTIAPVFNGAGGIDAVCINDVTPAEKLKVITDDDDDD